MPKLRVTDYAFLALISLSLFFVLKLFYVFVTPIVLALVLVSLFYGTYQMTLRVTWGNRYLAATLVTLLIVILVILPAVLFVATLTSQALALYEKNISGNLFDILNDYVSLKGPFINWLQQTGKRFHVDLSSERLVAVAEDITSSLGLYVYENLSSVASNVVAVAFDFVLMMVVVFSLLVAGHGLKQYFLDLLPLPNKEVERLFHQFGQTSRAVFVGNGVVSILEGFFGGLGIYLFGLGPAVFWGVVIAFTAFLPVVGVTIVVIPAAILLVLKGQIGAAILYSLYNAVYLIVLEGAVKPRLIGGRGRIHAVLILLAILSGVQVFGILGLFYGPLAITMFMSLAEIYKEHYSRA